MKKLKDIFYNKNDILVALIIVVVAVFVISGRIDAILAYPSSLEAQAVVAASELEDQEPVQYTGSENLDEGEDSTSSDGAIEPPPSQNEDQGEGSQSDDPVSDPPVITEPVDYSVYIAAGSTGEQIADILIGVGLMETRQEFYSAVSAASADTKLKAGTFIIPSTSTPQQVVSILTQ